MRAFFNGCGKAPPSLKAINREMGWTVANAHHVRLADSQDKTIVLDFMQPGASLAATAFLILLLCKTLWQPGFANCRA